VANTATILHGKFFPPPKIPPVKFPLVKNPSFDNSPLKNFPQVYEGPGKGKLRQIKRMKERKNYGNSTCIPKCRISCSW